MSQLLLQQGPDASLDAGMRLLEAAICSRNAECIEHASRRASDTYHAGTLCAAVFFSQECSLSRKIALDLISKRFPHNPGTTVESTAIGLAAMYNDQEMMSKLLNAIPSPSQVCNLPWTCSELIGALGDDNDTFPVIQKTRHKCRQGQPFWHFEHRQCSPLALPAFTGSHEGALALLRHGIRPGLCACNIAVILDEQEILSLLLCGQPPLPQWDPGSLPDDRLPLYYAVGGVDSLDRDSNDGYISDVSLVGQLLSAGADINDPDCEVHGGRSALQAAAEKGNLRMANFLLDQGAQVNGRIATIAGATALQLAVMHGHSDMVEMLLANGADVDAPACLKYGRTCLQRAAEEGRLGILELLIAKNIRTDGEHRADYVFAVVLADRNGHQVLAQRLKSYGGWAEWDQIVCEILRDMNRESYFPLSLATLDKAEIEAKVRLRLSGKADVQDCGTESSMMPHAIPIHATIAAGFEILRHVDTTTVLGP
ncbi:ankyrin repeat-containing domain protein [Dactylonectria macrodidyma]|uniref:Ankyrin repeat-containing domain protein n=1 Tax=Dactylonectria macrodidyma TaxID=307937 RepID=A0A9P9JJD4_9HYPO|nr:ankyrin repeat-containing domain protein [Dactylonectria macrodidyma]